MKTEQFDYHLPIHLIAQEPIEPRDQSRLLVWKRKEAQREERIFRDMIDYLNPGDVLVANNSRVIPARLFGRKKTGGKVEILLLRSIGDHHWRTLVGGKKIRVGTELWLFDKDGEETGIKGVVTDVLDGAERDILFERPLPLSELGHIPLPPYIHPKLKEDERYQTVYARDEGSAAAPTAGLHFTADLLFALREKGVLFEQLTLHVGLGTFQPVSAEYVAEHQIHSEWATLSAATAQRLNEAKLAGKRVIAVGTTSVRVLETAALRAAGHQGSLQQISAFDLAGGVDPSCPWQQFAAFSGPTDLFIYPGYRFRGVDGMISNFHLPKSSLLMLVSAFSSQKDIVDCYTHAIAQEYRFFSFGDAMFIL